MVAMDPTNLATSSQDLAGHHINSVQIFHPNRKDSSGMIMISSSMSLTDASPWVERAHGRIAHMSGMQIEPSAEFCSVSNAAPLVSAFRSFSWATCSMYNVWLTRFR